MTKEERDAVQAQCVSIDNIIISIERELQMLRTHLDILTKVCKTEPTISKMEQVDKDINVRSKAEPQTDGYMTAEQTEDYRKMLDKAEHKVCGNIEDEPQTERRERWQSEYMN